MMRVETIGRATLYLGNAVDLIGEVEADAVVSDPPYPNNAGHFTEGILAADSFCRTFKCDHWLVFWDEMTQPDVLLPLVARHIWHRTNTNRPDNYEPIYEFHRDGRKRASRVMPHCVIFPGLTGIEATGHPTEKNVALMKELVKRTKGTVFDPFLGSGATGVAAVQMGRDFIGCERDTKWFDIACKRIEDAQRQSDLFIGEAA